MNTLAGAMKSATIQVLLVEDDELFRLGLATRLQQEEWLCIAAEAEDGETAIALTQQQPFDIVVLDVGLPGIGGVETCRQIKQQRPELPILVLTSHSQKSLIVRLIEAQAQGYCLKGLASEFLILAIRSVAAGASWWDATATREIQTAFQTGDSLAISPSGNIPSNNDPSNNDLSNNDLSNNGLSNSNPSNSETPLTKREQEILALIASGKSNQEIAKALYIAPGTVRVHVHTILQKLDVRDRIQAAVLAIQRGLVEP